jgi:hypothetical protein
MKGNFHVRFLEESGREIAPSYSAKNYEGTEGRGCDKKRKSVCNRLNRGLNLPQPEKVLTYHWYLIV